MCVRLQTDPGSEGAVRSGLRAAGGRAAETQTEAVAKRDDCAEAHTNNRSSIDNQYNPL